MPLSYGGMRAEKTEEAMAAVLVTMRHVSAAILPMTVWILGIFEIVGETMIRFTSLMEKNESRRHC